MKNRELEEQEKSMKLHGSSLCAILWLIFFVLTAVLVVFIIPFCVKAKEQGKMIGNTEGKIAGVAVGSYEGVTKGISQGKEDGKKQGESAEDTDVRIANEMTSMGKLDVLTAKTQILNNFNQGNDYKALFVYEATAVFSVNLEEAVVEVDDDNLIVTIPVPVCELTWDEEASQKIAEQQTHFWSGEEQSGYNAYMNSMKEITNKTEESMINYETLMGQAKDSAIRQIEIIAGSMNGNNYKIEVAFQGEEE
jgi:hypothetical protein